jgi:hypothetical protein
MSNCARVAAESIILNSVYLARASWFEHSRLRSSCGQARLLISMIDPPVLGKEAFDVSHVHAYAAFSEPDSRQLTALNQVVHP